MRRTSSGRSLKHDLRRDLQLARGTPPGGIGVDRRRDYAEVVWVGVGCRRAVWCTVQDVKQIATQPEADAFGDRDEFGDAQIKLHDARCPESIAPEIPKCTAGRCGECRTVNPLIRSR